MAQDLLAHLHFLHPREVRRNHNILLPYPNQDVLSILLHQTFELELIHFQKLHSMSHYKHQHIYLYCLKGLYSRRGQNNELHSEHMMVK